MAQLLLTPAMEKRCSLITSFLDTLIALCASTPPALHVLDNIDPTNFPTNLLCSIDFVTESLVKLDGSKSPGPDGIASKMLKMTAPSIAPGLTKFFNLSLITGMLPTDWKLARVAHIQKRSY